jgi:hypothetical protein
MVDPVKAELGPERWNDDVAAWVRRARQGIGTRGPYDSRIAPSFDGSWGGPLIGPCPRPDNDGGNDNGNGNGGGDGDGNGNGNGNGPPKPTEPPPPPPEE